MQDDEMMTLSIGPVLLGEKDGMIVARLNDVLWRQTMTRRGWRTAMATEGLLSWFDEATSQYGEIVRLTTNVIGRLKRVVGPSNAGMLYFGLGMLNE